MCKQNAVTTTLACLLSTLGVHLEQGEQGNGIVGLTLLEGRQGPAPEGPIQ